MERFFTAVQRINSVLLLLFLLGIGTGILWSWVPKLNWRPRAEPPALTQEASHQALARLHFGEIEAVSGADTLMLRVSERAPAAGFSSGGGSEETRNIVFLSGEDKAGRWLFDKHSNLIVVVEQVAPEAPKGEAAAAKLLYFELVSADSDGDGVLSDDDDRIVALSRPDGRGFTEVLRGVSRVLSHQLVGERQFGVVYQQGKKILYARYALDSFKQLSQQVVAELPGKL